MQQERISSLNLVHVLFVLFQLCHQLTMQPLIHERGFWGRNARLSILKMTSRGRLQGSCV